jgi:hypothetical protein
MSARWDDHLPCGERERQLAKVMTLLSLDVTRACSADLGIEEPVLAAAQPELRRVLGPPFQARLADPSVRLEGERLLGSLDPWVQPLVRTFYDQVVRYRGFEPEALFCWGVVLTRSALDDALWGSLGLPPESSDTLRKAFQASKEWSDIQKRLDAAFARPLSAWDRQVAVLGLLPPEDEGVFGIGDQALRRPAQTVREQGFWRMAGELLGHDGLRALRARCQAFLETQEDIAAAFGQLHDPWLLAHPEITASDTSKPAES